MEIEKWPKAADSPQLRIESLTTAFKSPKCDHYWGVNIRNSEIRGDLNVEYSFLNSNCNF